MNVDQKNSVETLFLRNRHLLILSIVVSIAGGIYGLAKLHRFEDPRITNLYPIIITPFPGASAERVETLVTEPLEDELAEVDSIKEITSTSIAGVSIINIELAKSIDRSKFREVFAELRDKIESAKNNFPNGVGEPVFDDKRDPAAFSLMVALKWEHDEKPILGILDRLAEDLADRIRAVEGTEMVRLFGAPNEELTVEVDQLEMTALGLSASELARRIGNADSKQSAGTVRGRQSDILFEVKGEIDSVQRIRDVPVIDGDSQSVVRVGDIGTVSKGWQLPEREIAIIDGKRAVIVAARVGRERPVDSWSTDAKKVVEAFSSNMGSGVVADTIFEQSKYTKDRFAELVGNILLGMFVVTLVVFFMMGWRLGLVVGSSLPIVVALTLFTFVFVGEVLHQMSVYGIVIALGLLIDNAIVVSDEVQKSKARGSSTAHAVTHTVRHLFLPLLASTLTTVLAFLPLILLPGGPGDFVGAIGKSVVIAVSWSFFTSLTITASLAGIFSKPTSDGKKTWLNDGIGSKWLTSSFRWVLSEGLKMPVATISVGLAIPLAGFMLAPSLGNSFFPPADRDMFEIRVWMPNESTIYNTKDNATAIEKIVRENEEVTNVFWLVGGSFPRVYYNLPMDQDNSSHFAHAIISTDSNEATKRVLNGLQEKLDSRFPAAQVLVKQLRQGPPLVADVEYRIYGPSVDEMIDIGERLRRTLQSDPEVVVAQATMTRGAPKLWFEANEDKARIAGLTLNNISDQLRSSLDGATGGTMIEDLEELPVRVRTVNDHRGDISQLYSTNLVRIEDDQWTPISALGELRLKPELSGTTRYGGLRANIVKGYTTIDALPINVANRVLDTLETEGYEIPEGYRIELGGTVEQELETRADLMAPLPIIIVFMAATLILTFRSVLLASVLGVIAVMSVGMAILSTWLIDFPISFNTFMGTFGLIGVALNDSIVVMAAIRARPDAAAGEISGIVDAIIDTSRHVFSTTLTTVGGFLPLILVVGGDFWPSMSIVLAGGITGATIMAIVFIPASYRLLRRWVAIPREINFS